jgi:hypothetical protein
VHIVTGKLCTHHAAGHAHLMLLTFLCSGQRRLRCHSTCPPTSHTSHSSSRPRQGEVQQQQHPPPLPLCTRPTTWTYMTGACGLTSRWVGMWGSDQSGWAGVGQVGR